MDDVKVLQCPFCGSEDISDGEMLIRHDDGRITTQSQCMGCGAFGAEAVLDEGEIDYGSEKAISAWNTRV